MEARRRPLYGSTLPIYWMTRGGDSEGSEGGGGGEPAGASLAVSADTGCAGEQPPAGEAEDEEDEGFDTDFMRLKLHGAN